MTFIVRDAETANEVEPNGVECVEHGQTYTGPDVGALQNEHWDVCPENETHLAEPVHVTTEPLGVGNDDDFFVHPEGPYVYPLEEL